MTADERCARCGQPLPGADPGELDACVPCATIVALEIERDELLARLEEAEAVFDLVAALRASDEAGGT